MSKLPIKQFDSPEDLADYVDGCPSHWVYNEGSGDWGGEPVNAGVRKLREGCTDNLDKAQAIIAELDVSGIMSDLSPMLVNSAVGFAPNVPAAISNHPQCMFNIGWTESPNLTSPLAVYVETTVSAGVSHKELMARGVAVLAFCLAMETIRPVDLYIITPMDFRGLGCSSAKVRVASRPMDLGRAVYMLTSPTFARNIMFTAGGRILEGDSNRYIRWYKEGPYDSSYEQTIRDEFELQPTDVFLKGGHLYDTLMLTNPVQWVKNMIEKHRGTDNAT